MDLNKLKAQLIVHEGLRKYPYVDTVGKLSIGVGRNLTDVGLSNQTIMQMLDEDILRTMNFINTHFLWFPRLNDVRQRAIADMTFNLMGKMLQFKKMLAAIHVEDWNTASKELLNSKFASQVGIRAKTLAHMLRFGTDL